MGCNSSRVSGNTHEERPSRFWRYTTAQKDSSIKTKLKIDLINKIKPCCHSDWVILGEVETYTEPSSFNIWKEQAVITLHHRTLRIKIQVWEALVVCVTGRHSQVNSPEPGQWPLPLLLVSSCPSQSTSSAGWNRRSRGLITPPWNCPSVVHCCDKIPQTNKLKFGLIISNLSTHDRLAFIHVVR